MWLNLFLIYVGSVLILLGMLKLSNNSDTFREWSCIGHNDNYNTLVNTSLVPVINTFMCIIIVMAALINTAFKSGFGSKIGNFIKKIVE